eukprot:scaffold323_cov414-Prasinococcus_capsulatus_cf.AAC.26
MAAGADLSCGRTGARGGRVQPCTAPATPPVTAETKHESSCNVEVNFKRVGKPLEGASGAGWEREAAGDGAHGGSQEHGGRAGRCQGWSTSGHATPVVSPARWLGRPRPGRTAPAGLDGGRQESAVTYPSRVRNSLGSLSFRPV